MFDRVAGSTGIRSYRKAAIVLAGSTLLVGTSAAAEEAVPATAALPGAEQDKDRQESDGKSEEQVTVTGERYRVNTLNSRLPDVRDAPQSISIIPREVMEQQ